MLAQQKAENTSQESKKELKGKIDTITRKLDEKSKEQEELLQMIQNLQEALQRAANSSGTGEDWWVFSPGSIRFNKSTAPHICQAFRVPYTVSLECLFHPSPWEAC